MSTEHTDWLAGVGRRVKAARIAAGLTVRDAAEAAGISPSSVFRSESGTTDVCVVLLAKLAEAYNTQPANFLPPLTGE